MVISRRARRRPDRFRSSGAAAFSEASRGLVRSYSLHVRCIVHGGGFPDRCFQRSTTPTSGSSRAGALCDYLRTDSRYPSHPDRRIRPQDPLSEISDVYRRARGRWEGSPLVVETTNLKANSAALTRAQAHRAVYESRPGLDQYEVTFNDPETWTETWTAALDLRARPDGAGVYDSRVTRGTTAWAICYPFRAISSERPARANRAGRQRARSRPRDHVTPVKLRSQSER